MVLCIKYQASACHVFFVKTGDCFLDVGRQFGLFPMFLLLCTAICGCCFTKVDDTRHTIFGEVNGPPKRSKTPETSANPRIRLW